MIRYLQNVFKNLKVRILDLRLRFSVLILKIYMTIDQLRYKVLKLTAKDSHLHCLVVKQLVEKHRKSAKLP